ncbi:MAG: hypothetical protein AAB300_00335, partial [Nitrospirota bacterium]
MYKANKITFLVLGLSLLIVGCSNDPKTASTGSRAASLAQISAKAGLSSLGGVGGGGGGGIRKPTLSKITRAFKGGASDESLGNAGTQAKEGLTHFKASLKAYQAEMPGCSSGTYTATTTVSSDNKTVTTTEVAVNCVVGTGSETETINGTIVTEETDDEYFGLDPTSDPDFEADSGVTTITDYSREYRAGEDTFHFSGNGEFAFQDKDADTDGNTVSEFKADGTFSQSFVENGATTSDVQIEFIDFTETVSFQFAPFVMGSSSELSTFIQVINGSISYKDLVNSKDDFVGVFADFTVK